MKKILLLCSLASATAVMAQDIEKSENDNVKSSVTGFVESNKSAVSSEIAADTACWTFPGIIGLNASQTSYSASSTDGTGHLGTGDVYAKLNANYLRARHSWKNALNLAYGMNVSSEYENKPKFHKAIDEISLSSKYGYKLNKTMYLTGRGAFESQFARTYSYDTIDEMYNNDDDYKFHFSNTERNDTTVTTSKFANPATVKASLGIDFVPNPKANFSIFVSPITGNFMWCKDDFIAENYSMKLDTTNSDNKYMDFRGEIGALLRIEYSKEFNKTFSIAVSSETFFAYNKAVQKFDKDIVSNGNYVEFRKGEIVSMENYIDKNFIDNVYTLEDIAGSNISMNDYNGFYTTLKFDANVNLTKYIKLTFRSQLKYDNSELSYHRALQKCDKDVAEIDGIGYRSSNNNLKDYNYGFRKAYWQFWETTSLGVSYSF
ncbi:MAG: DUF3078 domain-containing protein [Paludibacteraceae bacterium]|nr:DUF3078 domain-containing protein [Paludibacteraceae bacterium]